MEPEAVRSYNISIVHPDSGSLNCVPIIGPDSVSPPHPPHTHPYIHTTTAPLSPYDALAFLARGDVLSSDFTMPLVAPPMETRGKHKYHTSLKKRGDRPDNYFGGVVRDMAMAIINNSEYRW